MKVLKALIGKSYLLVHEHIDDWVVGRGSLGKEGRGCSHPGVHMDGGTDCDRNGEDRVGRPADHECHYHDDDHACHLPVGLPGTAESPVGV